MWVLVWLVFCLLVGVYANKLGRSGILYFLISLILSPLLGFIILLVFGDANKIKCSNCGEKIDIKANICPFCGDVKKVINKEESIQIDKISNTTTKVVIQKTDSNYTFDKLKEIIINSYDKKYRAEITRENERLFFIHSTAGEYSQNYIQIQNKEDKFIIECFNISVPKELIKKNDLGKSEIIEEENSTDKLIELSKMLEKGLISKEEFEQHKSKL